MRKAERGERNEKGKRNRGRETDRETHENGFVNMRMEEISLGM